MAKKTKRTSAAPPGFTAGQPMVYAEVQRKAAAEYGPAAMGDAYAGAAKAAETLAAFLEHVATGMTDREKAIALRYFQVGYGSGYLTAAGRSQSARKRGASASGGKRTVGKSRLYAEIRAFVDATPGTPSQKVAAAAQHFDNSKATIYRAINEKQ